MYKKDRNHGFTLEDFNQPIGLKMNPENRLIKKADLILDATCAPQNISYPQDINLLNESREKLEKMIDTICYRRSTTGKYSSVQTEQIIFRRC